MELKFPMSEEEVRRYLAESAAALARKPVKSHHALVTIGSKTERGGEVVSASTGIELVVDGEKLRVARVGDTVRYADGTESAITSGAGAALCHMGFPVAIVGSHVANGDTLVESRQTGNRITQFADEPPIPGLLQPGYTPSSRSEVRP